MIGMCSRPWGHPPAAPGNTPLTFPLVIVVVRAALVLTTMLPACASSGRSAEPASDVIVVKHVDRASPAPPAPTLAGSRCENPDSPSRFTGLGSKVVCACRRPGDDTEKEPPRAGTKRLEIRLSVDQGEGVLESPTLGKFSASGLSETCYYLDVPAGSKAGFTFTGRAARPERGFTPRLSISEYGPAGPYWYEILSLECAGVSGRCDRAGADTWGARINRSRKRGRDDPCGSLVLTGLNWETSGGLHDRDGGYYRDFLVRFDVEVKKFVTQFAPHSTECVPK
jgi:hypothetical protein